MNPLLIYLKPKDGLNEVEKELKKIPCDRLTLKYFRYPNVYRIAHKTITNHPEYDYIIWLQNDIILKREDYFKLCEGIKETGGAILGASMNVDLSPKGLNLCAYSKKEFYSPGSYKYAKNEPPYVPKGEDKGIIKVFHNGGVFIAERDLLVQHPLRGMGKSGFNADILHGWELRNNGINYYLDTRIHLKHLRYQGDMMVGKKPPEVEIVRY